jgi:autophagy-related protein 16
MAKKETGGHQAQSTMEEIHRLILKRNAVETSPFLLVHAANATLLNQVDALQTKCDSLERECAEQKQQLEEGSVSGSGNNRAAAAALKSEARLREKVEKLQEELNEKLRLHSEDAEAALKAAKELSDLKDVTTAQEATISNLKGENERSEKAIERLTNELQEAESRTRLAEQQYTGLKETIRTLQDENDSLKEENRKLVGRLVQDKEKKSDEMNALTEMVEKLKKEVDMLRSLKVQEDKRRKWFGRAAVGGDSETGSPEVKKGHSARRFGSMGAIVPSGPKQIIKAHSSEAPCVRYVLFWLALHPDEIELCSREAYLPYCL